MAVYSFSLLASDIPSTTSDPVPVYSFPVGGPPVGVASLFSW